MCCHDNSPLLLVLALGQLVRYPQGGPWGGPWGGPLWYSDTSLVHAARIKTGRRGYGCRDSNTRWCLDPRVPHGPRGRTDRVADRPEVPSRFKMVHWSVWSVFLSQ